MNAKKALAVAIILLTILIGRPSGGQDKTSAMEQRLSIITIGCDNLQSMKKFYEEKFGWHPVAENKDILFFKLNGFLFGLYGRSRSGRQYLGNSLQPVYATG
jgi:hypothetical protein